MLASCAALLGWDEQTYMPRGGGEQRGQQLALLAGLQHETRDRSRARRLARRGRGVGGGRRSRISRSGQRPRIATVVRPPDETAAHACRGTRAPPRTASKSGSSPVASRASPGPARAGGDRQAQRRKRAVLSNGGELYNALLDEYEPGANCQELATLFEALRPELVALVSAIAVSSRQPDTSILHREFPVDRQRIFGETAAASVGFDFERGRLDTTEHPFCTGIGAGDTRITTRYDAHHFSDAFFGILHEVGHGLYDQGLDPADHGTPMGEAVSLGIHESQSRLWENIVGRGRPFWLYWYPLARCVFREALGSVSFDDFHRAVNVVEPSLIRVRADEVTYNLHVLIRFNSNALLDGSLPVGDVPAVSNKKYRHYLGVSPRQ